MEHYTASEQQTAPEQTVTEQQQTASEKQTTSVQEQTVSEQQQTSLVQEQTVSEQQKTSLVQEQTASEKQTTSVQEQTVSEQQQTTSMQEQTVSEQQQTTSVEEQTVSEQQQISSVQEKTAFVHLTACKQQTEFSLQIKHRHRTTTSSSNTNESFEPLLTIINKIADGERVPPQVTMRYEMLRFCTLRSFPKENKPYLTRLASAGFYYANESDEVICYCCEGRKRNWLENDNPMDVHKEINPNCSFLIRNSEVNVPMKPVTDHLCSRSNSSLDGRRHAYDTIRDSSESNVSSAAVTDSQSQASQNARSLIIPTVIPLRESNQSTSVFAVNAPENPAGNISTVPKYPKYSSIAVRSSSFSECGDIIIAPDRLSQAGFFYAGNGDCVRCFQCGIGLRHWSDDDDPWIEHSRWSQDCVYVLQAKGKEFVNLVQMAVRYTQNQNENEISLPQGIIGTGGSSSNVRSDLERLMHTDAAQSVLEIGYSPDVIRSAIRMVLSSTEHGILMAANILEKIFEIEDSENDQMDTQSNTEVQTSIAENLQTSRARENIEKVRHSPKDRNHSQNSIEECHENDSRRQGVSDISSSGYSRTNDKQTTNPRTSSRTTQCEEQRKLKEENDQLKQQSLCTKCETNDICIVFLPCGHLITCETCAPTVRYCTVISCGKYIKGTVRTYLS